MNNCIIINGQTIELTEEQVKDLSAALGTVQVKLSEIMPGNTFKIGSREFVVLDQTGDTAFVILRDLLPDTVQFGENNNYLDSNVDKMCNEFAQELAGEIGLENIVLHEVDLTSDDGLKDYGVINRRVSSITAEMYRKFVETLDKFKPNAWWWLTTAHSTATHENDQWVKCVSPSGYFNNCGYNGDHGGVRPFCILKSNIFVSK